MIENRLERTNRYATGDLAQSFISKHTKGGEAYVNNLDISVTKTHLNLLITMTTGELNMTNLTLNTTTVLVSVQAGITTSVPSARTLIREA